MRIKRLGLRLILLAVLAADYGCKGTAGDQTLIVFDQTPPPVRSAFLSVYPGVTIQKIVRQTKNAQDYYTFTYTDMTAKTHDVELNEGGDQIDQH